MCSSEAGQVLSGGTQKCLGGPQIGPRGHANAPPEPVNPSETLITAPLEGHERPPETDPITRCSAGSLSTVEKNVCRSRLSVQALRPKPNRSSLRCGWA